MGKCLEIDEEKGEICGRGKKPHCLWKKETIDGPSRKGLKAGGDEKGWGYGGGQQDNE